MSAKVLVIEDNPHNMRLMVDLLGASGYEVLEATSGEQGLQLARTEHPALVLMDLGLPGLDGVAATRCLREDPETAGIPIAAVTAHARPEDEERARAAGCVAFIRKPIDTRAFRAQVAELLNDPAVSTSPEAGCP